MDSSAQSRSETQSIAPSKEQLAVLPAIEQVAAGNGVADLFDAARQGFGRIFDLAGPWHDAFAFWSRASGTNEVVLRVIPAESDSNRGLRFAVDFDRLTTHLGVGDKGTMTRMRSAFPTTSPSRSVAEAEGYFGNVDQISRALAVINRARAREVKHAR